MRRGFTLIELSVVIVILAMFAAMIVPSLAAVLETNKRKAFRSDVYLILKESREKAISDGQVVTVSFDGGFQSSVTADQSEQVIRRVDSQTQGIQASHFTKDGEETGDTSWSTAFYPDGRSDGGSFELDEGNTAQKVSLRKADGRIQISDASDNLPDIDTKWDAGGYEKPTS